MKTKFQLIGSIVAAMLLVVAGCKDKKQAETPAIDGTPYLLTSQPADPLEVKELLGQAKDGDQVMVIGRIGGEKDPWVEGLAMFNLVDSSLVPCNEIPGDKCPFPWDYCCDPNVAASRTLVEIVDKKGKTVAEDARRLLSVTELQTIVVKGTARKDEDGNVTLIATGIFVKP
ncbi:MAG: hypothetical protein VB855_08605 [Pirellulaceae bacterium]